MQSLNVAKEEQQRYYSVVHTIMAEAGIIDSQKTADANEKDKRYKPFDKSPYGEFVNYEPVEGGRKRVNSYLLNEAGMSKVNEILTKHVTDRCLTKGTIQSARDYRDFLKSQMDIELLKSYLEYQGIEFDGKRRDRIVFRAPSVENGHDIIPYTCYFNNPTKVQYATADGKKSYTSVFWLIHSLEVPVLCNNTQEKAKRAARIFREWWNLQFNGRTDWNEKTDTQTSTESVQSAPGSEASIPPASNGDLYERVIRIEEMLSMIMKHLNYGTPVTATDCTANTHTKSGIQAMIKSLSQPLAEQKRYKTISREQIDKEKNTKRKKLLQQAYDYLDNRRLLTAKYKPQDGWKFDFQKNNIELLYRVDSRQSAVYNTRHRPLTPFMSDDGKVLKELANTGEKYNLPYGLEKIDYSYKTIFVTEGIFDSCFLKNCLAYSNWILPHEMSKVIDIYREAGFKIIHILDNFRLGDKGGVKGLEHIVTRKEWLSKGDKVFSWDIYSEFKDFNDVAIAYELDEIDPQTIIDHSWNEEEARSNYQEFVQIAPAEEKPIPTPSTNKESIYIDDDEMLDFLKELEQESA